MRRVLLSCGITAALLYVGTDIATGFAYSGYSFTDQAVSELFAIGAPTSHIVVLLFSLCSLLLLVFSFGIWMCSDRNSHLRLLAGMFAGSAMVGLVLWNFFPMHMRGAARGFTDTMHLLLATNPFVLLSLFVALVAFHKRFRWYTAATILTLLLPAAFAFRHAPELQANLPTPGLGLGERTAQYSYELWQVALALVLLKDMRAPGRHDA